jgi:hypothetical protein
VTVLRAPFGVRSTDGEQTTVTDRKQKVAAIDAALTGMFSTLEQRGVPEHLRNVVDQLDAAAKAEEAAARLVPVEDATPSPSPSSFPEP